MDFLDNVTGGDARLKGKVIGSQGALRGPDFLPVTIYAIGIMYVLLDI